jgi:hydroxymethylpyrimidine pyrophosphatase-like HAD family hydrolase
MFSAVGTPVAMGNARDGVKEAAGRIVAHVREGGLAEAIERFVLAGQGSVKPRPG